MADMGIEQIVNTVGLKNRVVDAPVKITFDGKVVEWAPGETKMLPRKYSEWFQHKSLYKFHPGDTTFGEPSRFYYKLCIVGEGDQSDLTYAETNVQELLDVSNMPDLVRVDPATGKPMRRVYIDPRSTGASSSQVDRQEAQAQRATSEAIKADAVETITQAASQLSEAEIDAQVDQLRRELTRSA